MENGILTNLYKNKAIDLYFRALRELRPDQYIYIMNSPDLNLRSINSAFSWENTQEGYDFWLEIFLNYEL